MFFVGILPAIIFCIGTYFMPRSPRWLVTKGKIAEAKKILLKFHKPTQAENALHEIQKPTLHSEKFTALIKNKAYQRLLLIGIALGIFQQFFGINVVMYYGPFIFEKAGFQSASSDILLTFYLGVVNTLLTIITGLIIDRFGRRRLLILGSVIAGCSLFTLSALFHIGIHYPWQGTAMLISMITFIIGYCISVGSLFWLIISEIFPLSIRGQAMSIATAIQWLANFVVSLTFLVNNQFPTAKEFSSRIRALLQTFHLQSACRKNGHNVVL
jgi:MFS family permease